MFEITYFKNSDWMIKLWNIIQSIGYGNFKTTYKKDCIQKLVDQIN